jgi:hypothetical protein
MIILDSNPRRAARSLDDRNLTKLIKDLQHELEIAQKLKSPRSQETAWVKQNIKWCKKYLWACAKEAQHRHGGEFPGINMKTMGPIRRPAQGPDGLRTFHQYITDTKHDYRPGKKKYWTNRLAPKWMSHRKRKLRARPKTSTEYDHIIDTYRNKIEHLAFSGTRREMSDKQRIIAKKIIREILPSYVHHGCCVGADEQIHEFCFKGLRTEQFDEETREQIKVYPKIIGYPPDSKLHRMYIDKEQFAKLHPQAGYLARNRDIINNSQLLVATPHVAKPADAEKSGTWYTIHYARVKGIPTIVIKPEGEVSWTS